MEDKKVSIIVPVYNVEKYVEACVESLRTQSHQNIEILLVDDGAKDNSPRICDSLAKEDTRIRVIHKPNGGAASARNAGIDAATGEYLCFVDGDDLVEKEYVRHLLCTAEEAEADITVCSLFYLTKKQRVQGQCEPAGCYTRDKYLLEFLNSWSCALMTNKLFRRSTVGTIRFEEGHCVDDEFFTYLVVMNCQKVVVTDLPLYNYRMRGSSVMQDMNPNLERIMLDRIAYITTRCTNVSAQIPSLANAFLVDAVDTMVRYWLHCKGMPRAMGQIRGWVNAHFLDILKMKTSWKQKAIAFVNFYMVMPKKKSERNPLQFDLEEYFS